MADRTLDTTWVGVTGNAALAANWSNGLPDDLALPVDFDTSITSVVFDSTSNVSVTSGLGFLRAQSTLTGTANVADLDTVTIDGKTYIFQATLTDVDGNVQRDPSTLAASLLNLFNAINLTGTPGTDYALSMTLHSTFTAVISGATQLLVAFKDGGVVGNGKTMTELSAFLSWSGSSANGADSESGQLRGSLFVDDYSSTIMSTGTRWVPQFLGTIYIDGTGTTLVHMVIPESARVVVNSPNYNKVLDCTFANNFPRAILEIVAGRVECSFSGSDVPPDIIISDAIGQSENLRMTGSTTTTGARLIVGPGSVTNNGINWTDVSVMGGTFINLAGTVAKLESTGLVVQETTDVMTLAYIMGGEMDLTQGSGRKTITDLWLGPLGRLTSRRDDDVVILHEIGRK